MCDFLQRPRSNKPSVSHTATINCTIPYRRDTQQRSFLFQSGPIVGYRHLDDFNVRGRPPVSGCWVNVRFVFCILSGCRFFGKFALTLDRFWHPAYEAARLPLDLATRASSPLVESARTTSLFDAENKRKKTPLITAGWR